MEAKETLGFCCAQPSGGLSLAFWYGRFWQLIHGTSDLTAASPWIPLLYNQIGIRECKQSDLRRGSDRDQRLLIPLLLAPVLNQYSVVIFQDRLELENVREAGFAPKLNCNSRAISVCGARVTFGPAVEVELFTIASRQS